jgi:hypothetical protein
MPALPDMIALAFNAVMSFFTFPGVNSDSSRSSRFTAWIRRESRPIENHTGHAGGQPRGEPPAEHLDRVWPDTGPTHNRQVAARRTAGGACVE